MTTIIKKNNILVTGGAGFIGSNFARYWYHKYPAANLVVVDALTYAGSQDNLQNMAQGARYQFIHGNILNTDLIERLLRRFNIECIVNFAAESHVDRSISDPWLFYRTNAEGPLSLLTAALNAWGKDPLGKRFVQISTDEVYGSHTEGTPPLRNSAPVGPVTPILPASYLLMHWWHLSIILMASTLSSLEVLITMALTNTLRSLSPRRFRES